MFFRKVLLLAVVALVASPALADSVRLYGIIDTGLAYVRVSQDAIEGQRAVSGSQTGMTSGVQSGSRWGMRGIERLSENWDASFALEAGVDSATGQSLQGGRLFGRQATLGLMRRGYFEVLAGRQITVSTLYFVPIDPLNLNFGQANMGASFGSVNTVRYDSLIQFQTEDWNGLRAGIGYSFNTGQSALYQSGTFSEKVPTSEFFGTSANMRAVTVGVQYSSGPWDVAITYDRVFGANSLPDISGSQVVPNPVSASPTAWILGASYDFGVIRVAGAFGRTYDGAFTGQHVGHGVAGSGLETITKGQGMRFTPGFDSQSVMLGFAIPIDEDSNLMFSAQVMQPKGSLVGNDFYATQRIVGMAYTYAISRRTNLYLWGSYGENFQMARSAKSGGVGAGVRYLF